MNPKSRIQRILFILALSMGSVCSGLAAPIAEIKTEGLRRIEKDAVLEKLTSKKGSEYQVSHTRQDLEALYGMGYFDEIEILEDQTEQGIQLTYRFVERPLISEIVFEGNEKISTSDLEDVIKIKKWGILDINRIQQDIELIQKQYEDKGYYLAKVSFETRPEPEEIKDGKNLKEGQVKLVYKVADYDKVEIKKISFLNNKAFSDEKLKSFMAEIKEGDSVQILSSSGTFKEASLKNDLQRLTYYYLDQGYVKFRFESPIVTVSEDKKHVFISVYVEEGEQYKVSGYEFSGDLLFTKDELRKEVKLDVGKVFAVSERNADIQRLTEKYQDLGYAFTNVIPKMDLNDEEKTVFVDYSFEKGSLVYFNEIRVIGNTKTYDKVIRRELRVYEGELFSGSKLRISRERVERLGFFAPGEVSFNQVPVKGRDDLLDLEITIKERSTGSVTLGAGYSSVQGFFFQGRIQEINLLGRGQNLGLDILWGRQLTARSISIDFTDPYAFDTRWSAGFSLFMANNPIPNRYLTRRTGVHLRLGHPLTDEINAFITYKFEDLSLLPGQFENEAENIVRRSRIAGAPTLVADPTLDRGLLSSIMLSVIRDVRNNRFETTDGSYQSVSLEIAGLGGVKNFAKFVGNNRVYRPLWGGFVFKNSTEIGALANTGGRGVPPAEKFYLGGPWNMRGFDVFSLAPVVMRPNNQVEQIGGSSELFSLFELERHLIREAGIKWVMFYDIGNAFSGVPGIDSKVNLELRQNAGFGIRWFSPLGPLRFEWGFPLNRRVSAMTNQLEDSPVFIFFIGQPF